MAVTGKASLADLQRTICELEAELEKRTAERDEGLARESAVAEDLQVINSSPGNLTPVFEAMLAKATSYAMRPSVYYGILTPIKFGLPPHMKCRPLIANS